jgi:hypothetical protein
VSMEISRNRCLNPRIGVTRIGVTRIGVRVVTLTPKLRHDT